MTQQEGLVMQVNEDHTIYMTYDGDFVKGVPVVEADVGEHGAFTPYKEKFNPVQALVHGPFIAVAASMVFILGAFLTSLPEAYAYVKLENGDLIEIGVDEDGNVVMLEGEGINPEWESQPIDVVLVEIAEQHEVEDFDFQRTKSGNMRKQLTSAIEEAEKVAEEKRLTEEDSAPAEEVITPVTDETTDEATDEASGNLSEETSDKTDANKNAPGNSGNAPGQTGATPGQSGKTPANGAAPPGQSGEAPGKSGAAPGKSNGNSGNSGKAPGKSESKPGNSETAPGQNKDNPGKANDKPGNSGNAPGHNKDNSGKPSEKPGNGNNKNDTD